MKRELKNKNNPSRILISVAMLLSTISSGYLEAQHIMQADGNFHHDGHVYTDESISTVLSSNEASIVEYKISREWADRMHHRTTVGGLFLGVTVIFGLGWKLAAAKEEQSFTSIFQQLFIGAFTLGSAVTSGILFATVGSAKYNKDKHLRSAIDIFNSTQRIGYDSSQSTPHNSFSTSIILHPTGVGLLMTF